MAVIHIEEPKSMRPGAGATDLPLLRLGFRPFYLLAAAFAAISVPLWLLRYFDVATVGQVSLGWHMHEMIFGFGIAVVIGFLFTAGKNWTGLQTPHGLGLGLIAGVWLAGRLAMLFASPPWAAVVDLCFLPLAIWPLFSVLYRSGNRRNMFLIVILTFLWLANAAFHAAGLGWLSIAPQRAVVAAILLIVLIESAIGGRVIPPFTANTIPGCKPIVAERRERISMVLVLLATLALMFGAPPPLSAALAIIAATVQLTRLLGWMPHRTLPYPLLWILHLAYLWIPIGFLLLAAASLGWLPVSAGIHALAVGSMAGMMLGMMTRTALGHTGRPLRAGRAEVAMYVLVQAGALARLLAALDFPALRNPALVLAGSCWCLAFVLYVVVYGPYLTRARADGREG